MSVLVDADDREHRDASGPDSHLVALLHEILLYRDTDDCLSSQLLADEFPSVSFHDVAVKRFARFAGIAAIGVNIGVSRCAGGFVMSGVVSIGRARRSLVLFVRSVVTWTGWPRFGNDDP